MEVGRHIAGATRMRVVLPGPSQVVCLFEDSKCGVAGLFERDGHADAGEPGADDRHVQIGFM